MRRTMSTPTTRRSSLEEVVQDREKALTELEHENMELKLMVYTLRQQVTESARIACDAEKRVARECTTNKTLRAALAEHRLRERALNGEVMDLERDMLDANLRAARILNRMRK